MIALLLQLLAVAAYAATAALGLRERRAGHARTSRALVLCGLLAVNLHATGYLLKGWGLSGPELHFFAALSLVALGMAVLTLGDGLLRQVNALHVAVMPLAGLAVLPYALAPAGSPSNLGWQIQLHAWLALLAYAVVSVSAVLALMLWVQERSLRQRRLAPSLGGLPPLVQVESLLFRLLAVGFGLLSAALLSGVVFVEDLFAQHLAHKTVLSLLAWAVLAALLFGRHRYGWRGRRAVRLTLLAMALLLLAFFGSKFVLELVLHRA